MGRNRYPRMGQHRAVRTVAMIDLHSLRIGDRVTMRYPNGILQEALLVGNDSGMLKFQFGTFVRDCVGPVVDIFLNGNGEWSVGPQ